MDSTSDPAATSAEPLLSLQGITKRFGSFAALSDVSLDIRPGEIHCILGENGAGKSTLCNLVFGVHRPDGGAMRYRGAAFHPSGPADALAQGIAMVHQHFSLVSDMTVVDNVAKSKEATLAAIAQGADVHYHILNLGLRGMEQAAKDKGTHIVGSYTDRCGTDPLYPAYSITGVGFQVEYAIKEFVAGTWKAGYKPFGLAMGPKASDMTVCGATPAMKAKLDEIKKDILEGKIKVLEG